MGLPVEMSITELADALGLPRRTVAYRASRGTIPTTRVGDGPKAKRVVLLETLRKRFPELYDAIVAKSFEEDFDGDDI